MDSPTAAASPVEPSETLATPAVDPAARGTDVYAIHGADPEVLAYAMARYSRSALTLRESLSEISAQRAEHFLNTFYFQYGHRSIADLAPVPMAVERLSLLAAIVLVDEQRWDGQERSTRYQDFSSANPATGWYTPELGASTPLYTAAVEALFRAYNQVSAGMLAALQDCVPRPDAMKPEAWVRTLKARAFDVARYLLPLATNTSLGQITNARTLETQVARLLSSDLAEVRVLGEKLRAAGTGPAFNPQQRAVEDLVAEIADPELAERARHLLLRAVHTAPTLVKYATANPYQTLSRALGRQIAQELLAGQPIEAAPVVDLLDPEPLELEIATSLLYPHCHVRYRQLRATLSAVPAARLEEITREMTRDRGRHDELLRGFHCGCTLRFDILMDIGGFRDMHRHRRATQLLQGFTGLHGAEDPVCPGQPTLAEAGLEAIYRDAITAAAVAAEDLRVSGEPEAGESAQYLLPLGMRCRSLFKMDFAQAVYIAELRSTPAGHFSYRRVAWEMYLAVSRAHPTLAPLFRIDDVNVPVDLLRR